MIEHSINHIFKKKVSKCYNCQYGEHCQNAFNGGDEHYYPFMGVPYEGCKEEARKTGEIMKSFIEKSEQLFKDNGVLRKKDCVAIAKELGFDMSAWENDETILIG